MLKLMLQPLNVINAINPMPVMYTCVIDSLIPFKDNIMHELFFPFKLNIINDGPVQGKYIRLRYRLLYTENREEVPINYRFNTILSTSPYIMEISITHFDGNTTKIFTINKSGIIINDDTTRRIFDDNWTKCFMDSNQNIMGYMKPSQILESYKVFNAAKIEMSLSSGFFSKMILGLREKIYKPNGTITDLSFDDDDFDEDAKQI